MTPNVKRSRRNIKYQEGYFKICLFKCYGELKPARDSLYHWRLGPYQVIGRVGEVPYRLDLPADMNLHPVFHVSMLRKHIRDPSAIEPERVEGLQSNLTYPERSNQTWRSTSSTQLHRTRRIRGEREQQGGSVERENIKEDQRRSVEEESARGQREDIVRGGKASSKMGRDTGTMLRSYSLQLEFGDEFY
ncbi:unnamed protein product [Microthlaspi erraticum]|uniref:Tf2-1-like SH3-like domain-containing protein n=1 Tax=Microthlaspi erraticum TaxID=1685480 RepID=A0A6D2JEW2_9BRAS|nr:unnamed protein product [Microthlaspi erraticum]